MSDEPHEMFPPSGPTPDPEPAPLAKALPSVDDHARTTKQRELWRHNCAATLHGWTEHAHHAGSPMRLSREDYAAALEAAAQPQLIPHGPALSPHCVHTFED